MTFVTKNRNETSGEAHTLRRYIVMRARGWTMPGYSRWDENLGAWVASGAREASGKLDGKRFRQVRRQGAPWCTYLGVDTVIAEDIALAAFFELNAIESADWNRLLVEVTRNRQRALKDWRRKGREVLARARAQREAGGVIELPPKARVAAKYATRGTGMRSLKRVKRD